jgi:S-DNA-T family DNA segregation ATPase FtsK/SpoIIIE
MSPLAGVRLGKGSPLRLNAPKVSMSAFIGVWLIGRVAAGLRYLIRHWILTGFFVVVVVTVRVPAVRVVVVVLVVAGGAALGIWRARWPDSFAQDVTLRVRGLWRASRVYRRRWPVAMVTSLLSVHHEGAYHLPRLVRVRIMGDADLLQVRMLPGQTIESWAEAADGLAQTFGVSGCRVRSVPGRPHDLVLSMLVRDPLVAEVAPFEMSDADGPVDLNALPVALGEDGAIYRLRLLGSHLLIVGATGSGKGSVIWSILAALAPGIGSGLVQVIALDPKGGVEFALGRRLFSRFVYGDPDSGSASEAEFADALEDQVEVMRRRQRLLRGVARLHTPTGAEPLIVVIIDELANLTAYLVDRDSKKRIATALALLLSQGRAVGVAVIGSVQDPKEVATLRDLFPTRIGLRMTDAAQVALVFGPGARERGARCDQIPENLPGIGYVSLEGVREPVRVRFTHMRDSDLTLLADRANRPASGRLSPPPWTSTG